MTLRQNTLFDADAIAEAENAMSWFLSRGKILIPLRSQDKRPLSDWRTKTFKREELLAHLLGGGNLGWRLGRDDLVIDIDRKHFPEDADWFANVEADFQSQFGLDLRRVPSVETGGGGFHFYLSKPSAMPIRSDLPKLGKGVEFWTEGHLMVIPPSIHPSGTRYFWRQWPGQDAASFPAAPGPVLTALEKPSAQMAVQHEFGSTVGSEDHEADIAWAKHFLRQQVPLPEGQGSDVQTYKIACALRDHNLNEATAAELMIHFWGSTHDDDWIREKCRNAYLYAIGQAGAESVAIDFPDAAKTFRELPVERTTAGAIKPTFGNCIALLRSARLLPTYDEVVQQSYLAAAQMPWPNQVGRTLSDDLIRVVRLFLHEQHRVSFKKDDVAEALYSLALENRINPLTDYLADLKWDGQPRLDRWLIDYLGAEDSELIRQIGRKTLLAAIRRARQPGCKFDTVLILEGMQGSGKSTAVRILAGDFYSDAELGRVDSKDAAMLLQGVWIFELGELTAMTRSEAEALKAFVSRTEDRFREPYARFPKSAKRRSIFIGTTNSSGYLQDLTGNRRFWPVQTAEINLEQLERDRDQLWAEACQIDATGEPLTLPQHLWEEASNMQEDRLADHPWVPIIESHISEHGVTRLHSSYILTEILRMEPGKQQQYHSKALKSVMERIGWTYTRGIRIGPRLGAGYYIGTPDGEDAAPEWKLTDDEADGLLDD
ncbi:MAG: hypothetical protein CL535_21105 [Ahrensia sp.]|nr:hypothetical protein [Ahrensia sp.]